MAYITSSRRPNTYWEEAVKAAAYFRNRCVTSALDHEMTPAEALTGVRPNIKGLRTWGCRAYALTPQELRRKESARSREEIFVGYGSGQKTYRLVDQDGRNHSDTTDDEIDEVDTAAIKVENNDAIVDALEEESAFQLGFTTNLPTP